MTVIKHQASRYNIKRMFCILTQAFKANAAQSRNTGILDAQHKGRR
jgi:hypothetical protein